MYQPALPDDPTTNPWLDNLAMQGMFTTDMALVVRGWNRWMEIHSGYRASEVLGRPLFELYPELLSRGLVRYYEAALLGQVSALAQGFHRYLLPMKPTVAEGALAFMQQSARIAPLIMEGQEIVGTITLIEDVTERVVHEAALQRLYAQAQEAVRVRDRLFSIASHELRTPITTIQGYVGLLQRRNARLPEGARYDEQTQKALDIIGRETTRLNQLIGSLLDLSQLQEGGIVLQRVPLNLTELVQQRLDAAEANVTSHRLLFASTMLDAMVEGDELRLSQVFQNLIGNAIKYSPAGGEIQIQLDVQDGWTHLSVRDQGIGIAPEARSQIFNPFYRATNVRPDQAGLGLGLYIVREFIELHGGRIEVESEEGQGSTFHVFLPLLL